MTRLLLMLTLLGACAPRSAPPQPTPAATTPAAPTPAASTPAGPASERGGVRFAELAPGVWMHTAHKELPKWGKIPTNGLVVIDGDGAILVDTAWDDAQTASILDWAETSLRHPIARAVFTHAHDDKMGGVGAVRSRGVVTYAHPRSNALAAERGLEPAENDLAFGADNRSADLTPLDVFYPGAGHTEDNIVVAVVDAGVLFGGCLIRPPGATNLGNTADGDVAAWDDTVLRVKAQYPALPIVVPSHGPPAGRELLDLTIALAREAD